jgi:hypothetical protein
MFERTAALVATVGRRRVFRDLPLGDGATPSGKRRIDGSN